MSHKDRELLENDCVGHYVKVCLDKTNNKYKLLTDSILTITRSITNLPVALLCQNKGLYLSQTS